MKIIIKKEKEKPSYTFKLTKQISPEGSRLPFSAGGNAGCGLMWPDVVFNRTPDKASWKSLEQKQKTFTTVLCAF